MNSVERINRCARAVSGVVALAALFGATPSHAQPLPVQGQPPVSARRGGAQGQGQDQGQRALMERRVQDRINNIVRTRLALTDEQFNQLRTVSARTETARRDLRRDEMAVRTELRRLLLATETPNETRIAELLEQLPKLERRRIDMLDQEQRELARFLQPSQRARYFALQDELRRNLQEGQRRRMGGEGGARDGGARDGGPPGGGPRAGLRGNTRPPPPPR